MDAHAARAIFGAAPPAEDHAARGTIQLRDSDHHGGLDGVEAALGTLPFLERLELHGLCGKIGHVEAGKDVFRGARIIVGRAAHKREAAERDQRVDHGPAILHEEALDGGALVQPRGEGGDHFQPA